MATMFQIVQFFNGNGAPLSTGKIYWYEAGTSTPKDTWVDQAESSPALNPVRLDIQGRVDHGSGPAAMWLRGSYKMVITDKDDNTFLTIDNINLYDQLDWTGLTATIADLNSTSTEALLKTSVYTIQAADRGKTILADATSGAFAINLPTAVSVGNKFKIIIKKIDNKNNDVTITPSGVETIDVRDNYKLHNYFDFIEIHSDGSNWYVVASQIRGTVRAVITTTTLDIKDNKKLVNADTSGGAFDVTLPSAVVVGNGWITTIKKVDSSTNIVSIKTTGGQTIDGVSTLPISSQYFSVTAKSDGANYYVVSEFGDTASGGALPKGYLRGFGIFRTGPDVTRYVTFPNGAARSEDNTLNIVSSGITKHFDTAWGPSSGAGGFAGSVRTVSKWYHCFVIATPSGVMDAGFDDNINATNLLLAVAAFGFTVYKRVGSIRSQAADSSRIKPFTLVVTIGGQRFFTWETVELEFGIVIVPPIPTIVPLSFIPPDVKVNGFFNVSYYSAGALAYLRLYETTGGIQTPSNAVAPLFTFISNAVNQWVGGRTEVITDGANPNSQILYHSTEVGVTELYIATLGWEE